MDNEKTKSSESMNCVCRQGAVDVLRDRLYRQSKRAHGLEILLKVIPWELICKEDEEVLWDLFCSF